MTAIGAGLGRQRQRSRRRFVAILLAYSLVLHTLAFALAYSPATAGVLIDRVICADGKSSPSRNRIADLGIAPTHEHGAVCLLCLADNTVVLPGTDTFAVAFVWQRTPTDPVRNERLPAARSPAGGRHARAPPAAI